MSQVSRRTFLSSAIAASATAALVACAPTAMDHSMIDPTLQDLIEKTEAARFSSGKTKTFKIAPSVAKADLGAGKAASAKLFNQSLPGSLIRADYGDLVKLDLSNGLDENTSLHTHGLALRNDMDGVVGLTQEYIKPGATQSLGFKAPHPGTYWYHSHTGLQPEEGMYGPIIIDDLDEKVTWDTEWLIMLDDWTLGIGSTPEHILDDLLSGAHPNHSMSGMDGMGMGGMMGGTTDDTDGTYGLGPSDVAYPAYIINGKLPEDPEVFSAKPGERIRIRVVNAGSDTAFIFALSNHELTITHSDGFGVKPVIADSVVIGMGERYDILVTAKTGAFNFSARPIAKDGVAARAVLKTDSSELPSPNDEPTQQYMARVAQAKNLAALTELNLTQAPAAETTLMLMGNMSPYKWSINGDTNMMNSKVTLRQGETMRINFMNHSMMFHPMHLHGHTFQVRAIDGYEIPNGPRKDTVIVKPMSTVSVDVLADNPGLWALHCHNTYHMESGMMTSVKYALN